MAATVAVGALLLAGAGGCSTGAYHTAANLPDELRAPPVLNAQTVDLSRFTGPPVDSERIAAGDVVEVSVAPSLAAEDMTTFPLRVGEDGVAHIPEVGSVRLAGLRLMEAERQIAAASVRAGLYRQPQVTVRMTQRRTNRIEVIGGVAEPGIKEIPRDSSYLFGAIVAAGGLSEDAGTRVGIRQPGGPSTLAGHTGTPRNGVQPASHATPLPNQRGTYVSFNLADPNRAPVAAAYLQDGAVVTIEKRQPEPVQVIGLVKRPTTVDFPINHDLRLYGAIAKAGGLSSRVADEVVILRNAPNGQPPVRIRVSLREAKQDAEKNLRLAPGDIVSVEQTPATVMLDALNVIRFGIGASVPLF